ncbi:hypothetical protein Bbelb_332770 [Branchiostoma belcheri]|nr:hypothetical protein Bbelb_332770 [Branchiostoma belcheri]
MAAADIPQAGVLYLGREGREDWDIEPLSLQTTTRRQGAAMKERNTSDTASLDQSNQVIIQEDITVKHAAFVQGTDRNSKYVQIGDNNRMVIGKVTPQEDAFVKACCELGIDPRTADDIREKLSRADVLEQFAKKMAETYSVTCSIRSATKGCILLELEVPTEADRLQLLRMARDGTFQEGRAVNMNLAIGIRNPSQEMLDELQEAVASNTGPKDVLEEEPPDNQEVSVSKAAFKHLSDSEEDSEDSTSQDGATASVEEAVQLEEAAANVPREEFDDQFLTCQICMNIYNNPRVLPCLHTFLYQVSAAMAEGRQEVHLSHLSETAGHSTPRAKNCPEHNQPLTFYCKPCAKLVCRDCTITEHSRALNHDPQEVSKVAQKVKTELQTLLAQTQDTADTLKKTAGTVSMELTSITANCELQRKKIQGHFAQLRAKLDKAEQEVKVKLDKMDQDQKEPLLKEKKCARLDTTETSEGVFEAVWRPHTSGKHQVGVTTGGGGGATGGEGVCYRERGWCYSRGGGGATGEGGWCYRERGWCYRGRGWCYRGGGGVANPGSVAVQTDGTIVVRCGKEVKKFSPSGEELHKFPLGEYCTNPYGLAVQRGGRVVVADIDKHSIFLFEADGTLVFDKNLNYKHKFGQYGRQPQDSGVLVGYGTWVSTISSDGDKLKRPHGVAVTEDGHVFVTDTGDHCIRKYRYM